MRAMLLSSFFVAMILLTGLICSCAPRNHAPAVRPDMIDVVYVIDGSSSMIPHFTLSVESVARAIKELEPGATFACVFAGENSTQQFGPLVASDDAHWQAIQLMSELQPEGGRANLEKAIRTARNLTNKEIWVVSDGRAAFQEKFAGQTLSAVVGAENVNTVLHFSSEPQARQFLFELARRGGGLCLAEDGNAIVRSPIGYGTLPNVAGQHILRANGSTRQN